MSSIEPVRFFAASITEELRGATGANEDQSPQVATAKDQATSRSRGGAVPCRSCRRWWTTRAPGLH